MNPQVDVIIPCYNVEKKILNMLRSLDEQTYDNFVVYFIDDGSTDNTKKVINDFIKKHKEKNKYHYIFQKNRGLAGAINRGLKEINGDYLIWPDADDWLSPDSISKKVFFLENNKEYDVVSSNAYMYNEKDFVNPFGKLVKKINKNILDTNQFNLLLRYRSQFCPGIHMIRVSSFKKINPKMEIFEGKHGQNFQMLLPMYYFYKRYFIDECLYNYVVYGDSMSHKDLTLTSQLLCYEQLKETIINTLKMIKMCDEERNNYLQIVEVDDNIKKFELSVDFSNRKMANEFFLKIPIKNLSLKVIVKFIAVNLNIYPDLKKIKDSLFK